MKNQYFFFSKLDNKIPNLIPEFGNESMVKSGDPVPVVPATFLGLCQLLILVLWE